MILSMLASIFELLVVTTCSASILIFFGLILRVSFRKWIPIQFMYLISMLIFLRLILLHFPSSELSFFHWSLGESTGPSEHASLPSPAESLIPMQWFALIWLGGVFCLGLKYVRDYLYVRRWVRSQPICKNRALLELLDTSRKMSGVSQHVPIHIIHENQTPSVFGFFKPRILLPERLLLELRKEDLRHVLLHELCHIRRRDTLLGGIASFIAVLHWFNPFTWLVLRQFALDRELLCDRSVLQCLGNDACQQNAYGETILRMISIFSAPLRVSPGHVSFLRSKMDIRQRISSIVRPLQGHWFAKASGCVLVIGFFISCFTIAAPAGSGDASPDFYDGHHHQQIMDHDGENHSEEISHSEKHGTHHER